MERKKRSLFSWRRKRKRERKRKRLFLAKENDKCQSSPGEEKRKKKRYCF